MTSFIIQGTPLLLLWLVLLSGRISTYEIPKDEGPIKVTRLGMKSIHPRYIAPTGEIRQTYQFQASKFWDDTGRTSPRAYTKPKKEVRIHGGKTTPINQVPYQVAIDLKGLGFLCGGSIYNKLWIISAAHCFVEMQETNKSRALESFTVTAGEFDTSKKDESEQSRKIVEIVPYKFIRSFTFELSLLKLDSPLEYNEDVQPIPIMDAKAEIPKGVGIVSGWGYPRMDGGYPKEDQVDDGYTSTLQSTNIHLYAKAECLEIYSRNYEYFYDSVNHPHELCAGELNGVGGTYGDPGGPLVCYGPKEKYLCGVVSSCLGPGLPQRPGLFTIVSHFADWIKEHAGEGDRPTKSY